jgi:3-oxoacyl-[acyl-carrier-protein] synthase-3
MIRWGERTTPLGESDAELAPCEQTALEILGEAIQKTR